ncbi:hypothetical protein [Flavobacterium sp.]|uniref:hypothetical protein n=1 Tax=Flavobacterium sp. TaxID=239 RepID=UPI002B4B92A6|nr:hypothetical protein [Flavobacterium sp.]HLF51749.1 hypothetical protein [Flavobacterium sp.]
MKTKFLVLILLFTTFFIGCKNDKSVDDLEVVTPKVVESKVKVVLDMIVPQDDNFQLFYTEDGTLNFNDEKSVRVAVKGSDKNQSITFDLPEDSAFTFLRLDLGENNKQAEMKMNNFLVKYFDKKFEAKGNLFFQYFAPNAQLEMNIEKSTVTPITGKEKVYDPIMYPLEPLGVELQKLLK